MIPENEKLTIRRGRKGAQLAASGRKGWSADAEEAFFASLAATANVRLSARKIGFCTGGLYRRRYRYPDFARKWEDALGFGYTRVEALLIKTATDTLEGRPIKLNSPIPRMTVKEAINLLALHHRWRNGDRSRLHRRPRVPDAEAARAEILKKVDAYRRAMEAGLIHPE